MTGNDKVWKALGNSIRRDLLDLLRDGPRTTGNLAENFGGLSRFAVMQHLGVLEEAGLVLVRRSGRVRFNFLNAVPIQQIHERWVHSFAAEVASRSLALKQYVETEGKGKGKAMSEATARAVKLEHELRLEAPIETVWAASTTEQLEWYPPTYGQDRVKGLIFEEKVGGLVGEDWGKGQGVLYGLITHYDPPHAYSTRGWLAGGILIEQVLTLESDGDATVLKGSTVTFGEISDEMEEGIRMHGDLSKYEEQLRSFVESKRAKAG